jgi:hypothetical protein
MSCRSALSSFWKHFALIAMSLEISMSVEMDSIVQSCLEGSEGSEGREKERIEVN